MSNSEKPLLIKRYASRRLYNTETSDYVTLEDIAGFIRDGREVQIVDLKSGDDLTRQYLLQIIAEHESRGESVLPINVLNDLVRSYTTQATSMVPQFLAQSFEMFRDSQSKWVENMNAMNPMAKMPGFEAMQAQQEAFMKAMTQGGPGGTGPRAPGAEEAPGQGAGQGGGTAKAKPAPRRGAEPPTESAEDIEALKKEFAELQAKLAKFGK